MPKDLSKGPDSIPFRILLFSQFFDPEPGWRGMNFARWLGRHGCEIEVLTGVPNYPLGAVYPNYKMRFFQREQSDGIPILRVPLYPSHDVSALKRATSYLTFMCSSLAFGVPRTRKADVVFVYNLPTVGLVAFVLKLFRGTPFVFNIPDLWPESVIESGMVGKNWLSRFIEKALSMSLNFIYRQAAAITVLSEGFKRILVERGVPIEKISVIYNWADDEMFRPVSPDENLRHELGFAGKFNFLYAGNVGAMQGVDTLIRAAKRLDSPEGKIQLVIMGTGQCLVQIKQLANQLNVRNVTFLDWRSPRKMLSVYAIADVLVIHLRDRPLFRATIPGKTQVSLAVGRPILMAVPGECQDIILRAQAGMVCEPENDLMMAKVMTQMAALEPEVLKTMGRNGRAFYEREMSESVGARALLDVLQRAGRQRC
jgi:colanic acid biosynthesis glycosyl transferase WcaI